MSDDIYHPGGYGRQLCDTGDFPRHAHPFGYICLVLNGRFAEAGDAGRFRVEAGDALVHRPFEAHLDVFGSTSPSVLNLPLVDGLPEEGLIRVANPDAIAFIAETDPYAASQAIAASYLKAQGESDWPDLLAADLRNRLDIRIGEWAAKHGLAAESVSRGFRQVYGTSAARYRAQARARRACRIIAQDDRPLAEIALDLGFADQAHMTRALKEVTGLPPAKWRRQGQLRSRPA